MLGEVPRSIGPQLSPAERFRIGEIGSETYAELMLTGPVEPLVVNQAPRDKFTTPEEIMRNGRLPKQSELGALVGGMRPDGVPFTYDDFFAMTTLDTKTRQASIHR